MTSLTLGPDYVDQRCSVVAAALGEDPAGTAGTASRYLLVELPLPWTSKIDQHPLLAAVTPADPTAGKTQLMAIDGVQTELGRGHRLICYHRDPAAPFVSFTRSEALVEEPDLAPTVSQVVSGDLSALDPVEDDLCDLLICTHGTRDRCCGRFGTLLHRELEGQLADNVRLWRTSHTGGHRFAPTGVLFPSGTTWAGLDAATVRGIVDRSVEPDQLAAHWRGTGGVTTKAGQIADGIAFGLVGWSWLDRERTVAVDHDEPRTVVKITGGEDEIVVELQTDGSLPVPACGQPIETATKSSIRYRVTAVHQR